MFNDPLECWLFHNFIFFLNVFLWLIAMTSFQVCNDFQVDTAPWTLLCNVHWLVMIGVWRKLKDICQQIHDSLIKQKISDCFLVGIEFQNHSFVLKAINVSQILSNESTQQNCGITVIILKNSLPQKKTFLYHWKITVLTLMQ